MEQLMHDSAGAVGGRLLYLAENLASLHAAQDLGALAGRFEFLGEKAVGAELTALALPDETGAYRAVNSTSPRPATARALWEELGMEALSVNDALSAAFAEVAAAGPPESRRMADVFPERAPTTPIDEVTIAPVAFNRELIGIGLFVVAPDAVTMQLARVLADHAAVAIHQIRQREEAGRLHSVDATLWVPDENFLVQQLTREVNRARRYGREVGVALLRLENEGDIRERFGDFFTDHLLRRIGSQLMATVRDSDVLGALAGGFAVIHTETPLEGTDISAARLRDAALRAVLQRFPEVPEVRISVVAAGYPESSDTVDGLLAQLDSGERQSRAA